MELIAAIGGGAFVLASLVLGGRLMWLSRRTRGLPELALGAALFSMGGVGYPLMAVAQQATGLALEVRCALVAGNMVLTGAGMTGVALFNYRVFRPRSGVARALAPLTALGYAAFALAQIADPGMAPTLSSEGPWRLSTCVGIGVMLWAGTEALLYWRLQRKRMSIGLADPVVADRFRLWSVSIYSAATISITALVLQEGFGIAINGTTAGHLVVGPLGLVAAYHLWLAFLPPAAYVRRVAARAAAAAA